VITNTQLAIHRSGALNATSEASTPRCKSEIHAPRMEAKVNSAKAYLGTRWILHPAYRFNPRHSYSAQIWQAAPGVLDEIQTPVVLAFRP